MVHATARRRRVPAAQAVPATSSRADDALGQVRYVGATWDLGTGVNGTDSEHEPTPDEDLVGARGLAASFYDGLPGTSPADIGDMQAKLQSSIASMTSLTEELPAAQARC